MAVKAKYKEAKLPKRLDKAIGGASWQTPDVLVGALRNRYQLDVCLECDFYHMPATSIDPKTVRYVAMYQSITLFGRKSGIHWYGKVAEFEKVRRYEIDEIPRLLTSGTTASMLRSGASSPNPFRLAVLPLCIYLPISSCFETAERWQNFWLAASISTAGSMR